MKKITDFLNKGTFNEFGSVLAMQCGEKAESGVRFVIHGDESEIMEMLTTVLVRSSTFKNLVMAAIVGASIIATHSKDASTNPKTQKDEQNQETK